MRVGYAHNDSVISRSNDGDQGRRLANAQRHAASLWLKWDAPADSLAGLSLGGGLQASSPVLGNTAGDFSVPGYARADAYAAYRLRLAGLDATAQLNINNLFDRQYFASAGGRAAVMPAAPRQWVSALRVAF